MHGRKSRGGRRASTQFPRLRQAHPGSPRAGIWRLARLFDSHQVPVTIGACARGLERNPEVAEWIAEAGHDVIGHGYRWAENSEMTIDEERDDLRRGIEAIERLTGERPLGWYCRSFPSIRTRELIVEEGGFLYDSDASNDELPYFVEVGSAPFLVLPYSKVYNDNRYLISPTYATPNDFFENLRAAVGYLCDEAAAGHGARMMTVGLHERWSGQANRATAIRDFVEYAASRPDVRFMRRLDIARWWLAHHQEWDSPPGRSGEPQVHASHASADEDQLKRGLQAGSPARAGLGRQAGSERGLQAGSPARPGLGRQVGLLSSALPGLDPARICELAAATAAEAAGLGRLAASHGLAVCGLAVCGLAVSGLADSGQSAQDGPAPGGSATDAGGSATDFERLLELARAMGAPRLRVLAPAYADGDVDDQLRRFAGQLAQRASLAAGAGILAPDQLGAVYGPGAMVVEGNVAPRLAIAALGRYLQHVQVRDTVPRRAGQIWEWASARPGEGLVCWPDVLTALAAAGYGGWLVIDRLSGPDGLPGDVAALRRLVTAAAAAAAAPVPATEGDRG